MIQQICSYKKKSFHASWKSSFAQEVICKDFGITEEEEVGQLSASLQFTTMNTFLVKYSQFFQCLFLILPSISNFRHQSAFT